MKQQDLFFLNGKRAMISLGPLNEKQHCPYKCAFCYVQDGFSHYANLDIDSILAFLISHRKRYEIIYISGDTDSFAPPRTDIALDLLHRISHKLDVDMLFTTRTVFNSDQLTAIKSVADNQRKKRRRLYACISITRYSKNVAYIEPSPIPSPDDRIETLIKLKKAGATTVLTLRPFLPVVDVNDYITILAKSKEYVDIALGESFYFIPNGAIYKRVFPDGIPELCKKDITHGNKMVFDTNDLDWDVWDSSAYEAVIRQYCDEHGIIFAMHSKDAIAEYETKFPLP